MNSLELEQKRQLALERYGLLDTAPEAIFDGITVAIANICEVPITLISLVDANRQWFKSSFGLTVKETPRDVAFCNHAISRPNEMMIVEDAMVDPRFQNNPLVTDDPRIRFYAGSPIVTIDGYALGTLCVIDRKPRRLLKHQIEALNALGKTVSAILNERHRMQDVAIDRDSIEDVLHQRADRYQRLFGKADTMLRGLVDRLPSAAIVINPDTQIVSFNGAWTRLSSSLGLVSTEIGEKYLGRHGDRFALAKNNKIELQQGIKSVLTGRQDRFDYKFSSSPGTWTIDVEPIAKPVEGALVQHFYSESK